MNTKMGKGKYFGVATVISDIAERQSSELDRIESDLDAGRDAEALAGMREFFHKKQVDREQVYDRENERQARA